MRAVGCVMLVRVRVVGVCVGVTQLVCVCVCDIGVCLCARCLCVRLYSCDGLCDAVVSYGCWCVWWVAQLACVRV